MGDGNGSAAHTNYSPLLPIAEDAANAFAGGANVASDFLMGHVHCDAQTVSSSLAVLAGPFEKELGEFGVRIRGQRQHALLLISFMTLVITGFMLKFPESFWAAPLVRWERGLPIRGLVHRIAGVVLIGAGFYHLLYLVFTPEGRRNLRAILPKVRDVREAVQTVGYNLGYRREAPLYFKFNYAEKLEY